MRNSIRNIDGPGLAAGIKEALSPADRALLDELIETHGSAEQDAVKTALDAWNAANARTMARQPRGHFIGPAQRHRMTGDKPYAVDLGTFPTTSAMRGPSGALTLSEIANATVIVISFLLGLLGASRADVVLGNLMPTTLDDDYTKVPTAADFELFAPATDAFLLAAFTAGLRVVFCISDKNLKELERLLRKPRVVTLLDVNGTKLKLLVPTTGTAVLAVEPHEHLSHVLWRAMKLENRLWLLLGLLQAHAAAAALLGRPAPRIDELLAAVDAVPYAKWYKGGAYMEATMRAKLAVYIAAYGVKVGTARWRAWYLGCKSRAGAPPPAPSAHTQRRTTPSVIPLSVIVLAN